jgi:hypothetical protein
MAMTKRKTNTELAREIWDSAQPISGTPWHLTARSGAGLPPLRAPAHPPQRPIFSGDDRAADQSEDR